MHHRVPLPPQLGELFTRQAALAAGIGPDRCDVADLHRPFPGIRSLREPETFAERLACCALRLKPRQLFGGKTAARKWGLPAQGFWKRTEDLEVYVPPTGAAPKTDGIRGRRLKADRARTWTIDGVPVLDPVATLFTCASALSVTEAVMMLDALVTDADNYPHLRSIGGPLATLDEVARRLAEWGRFAGCATIRAALPLAREHVESPKETETRLMLLDGGLPEPVVQFVVRDEGRFIARVDLAYPELRIAMEYEGDGHRTDKAQWRIDIQRQRELEDRGWQVIRLTQLDLGAGRGAVLARIRHAIAARSRGAAGG